MDEPSLSLSPRQRRAKRGHIARTQLRALQRREPRSGRKARAWSLPTSLPPIQPLRSLSLPNWWQMLASRVVLHSVVACVTLVTVLGDGMFQIARRIHPPPVEFVPTPIEIAATDLDLEIAPEVVPPDDEPRFVPTELRTHSSEPLAPPEVQPLAVPNLFRAMHTLNSSDTLGGLAAQYGVSLEALIAVNQLESGDVLALGQELRIPLQSGVTYVIGEGDTLSSVAAALGVGPEVISSFGPNRIGPDTTLDTPLPVGREIFIPSEPQLPSAYLELVGGIAGAAELGPEPAGRLLGDEINLREGPSREHERITKLPGGRQVRLLARHEDWLKIESRGKIGWIRGDLIAAEAATVAELPISNNFPPPPPHWVWPARGTLTSGFGPRWGSFHNGIDIANRAWSPIVAASSGRVIEAGWCRGYGYCVKIRHAGGIETHYGHMIDDPVVSAGDDVAAGDLIGHMGSTYDRSGGGYSTGVHLHFTLLVNKRAVNPLKFLP